MWSYVKRLTYYFGIVIEIVHVLIQAVIHYIFSRTEKTIRNEIVLITGSGRGLGKINIHLFSLKLIDLFIVQVNKWLCYLLNVVLLLF